MKEILFEWKIPEPIESASTTKIEVWAQMSTADYFITLPSEAQLSDPPLSGKWFIKTFNTDGSPCVTSDMPLTYTADQV